MSPAALCTHTQTNTCAACASTYPNASRTCPARVTNMSCTCSDMFCYFFSFLEPPRRELSWVEHGFPRGNPNVGGGGGVRGFRSHGPMLQVSRSAQKLLAVSKVSEQFTSPKVAIHVCFLLFSQHPPTIMSLCWLESYKVLWPRAEWWTL